MNTETPVFCEYELQTGAWDTLFKARIGSWKATPIAGGGQTYLWSADDISGADILEIIFIKPDGTESDPVTASFSTGGTDGFIEYRTVQADVGDVNDTLGLYRWVARVATVDLVSNWPTSEGFYRVVDSKLVMANR